MSTKATIKELGIYKYITSAAFAVLLLTVASFLESYIKVCTTDKECSIGGKERDDLTTAAFVMYCLALVGVCAPMFYAMLVGKK
jgi:hypothetical protein